MKPDNVPGVASDADLAHDAAYIYCNRAFAFNQDNPRLAFQNGRVNHARNPYRTGQPLQMFKIAYRGGSEIAGTYIAKLFPAEARKLFASAGQRNSAGAGPDRASWFNGLAMEVGGMEASYNGLAARIGCCADTKAKVAERFPSIRTSLKKTERRAGRGRLYCSNMALLALEVGFLKSWLDVLSMESQGTKHRGSISAADAVKLDALRDRVAQNKKSIEAKAAGAGCAQP